jgi:ElaB/YqjD/DUF883 family membrane-anchored ribosome-binding protein
MTQWNQNQNGIGSNRPNPSKSPEEIESEIARTRGAISSDINELGEKFNPDKLRESAKGVIADAKDEARDLMREAKDAAVDSLRDAKNTAVESLRHAKDSAVHTVSDTVHEIGTQARRAGGATAHFASENAVPLGLIGLGVAWLTWSLRQNRSSSPRHAAGPRYSFEDELDREWEENADRAMSAQETPERAHGIRERIRPVVQDQQRRMNEVGQRARDLSRRARERLHGAEIEARDFALDNPVAIGAVAVAAGIGVGLLLPGTAPENELMGEAGARMMNDARRTARRVARTAKDTVNEVKGVITDPL